VLFPSRLETWGLPLTEFSSTQKPIFAADLPYAYETLGGHHKAYFFNPTDATQLARMIGDFVKSNLPEPVPVPFIQPDFTSWEALFDHIFA
jgi:glycosyltransferase involved in cell wall biosynthesis